MRALLLLAEEGLESAARAAAEEALARTWSLPVRRGADLPAPRYAWRPDRRQFDAGEVLLALASKVPPDVRCVLAILRGDLAHPLLTYVFGQAQLGGRVAVMSVARLHPEFHGLPPRPGLLEARTAKEAIHETGHAFGLTHCPNPRCPMSAASGLAQVDAKGLKLCLACSTRIVEAPAQGDPAVEAVR